MPDAPPPGFAFYANMRPGDQFYREQYEGPLVAVEILRDGGERRDPFGRTLSSWYCRRLDNGQEGHVMYGPGGHARVSVLDN